MSTTRRGIAAAATAVVLATGLSACSKSVDANEVEDELSRVLKAQPNAPEVNNPSCKDDLKAEVGATTDCEIEVGGEKRQFKAKVTSVDGKKVRFSFAPP